MLQVTGLSHLNGQSPQRAFRNPCHWRSTSRTPGMPARATVANPSPDFKASEMRCVVFEQARLPRRTPALMALSNTMNAAPREGGKSADCMAAPGGWRRSLVQPRSRYTRYRQINGLGQRQVVPRNFAPARSARSA